jgi:6-phosphofructokinase 2
VQIVTVTINPSLDLNTQVRKVAADRKLRCAQPQYEPGGGGLNVSRAIRKLGGESLALWTCGGPNGRQLAHLLEEENIQQDLVEIGGMTRENVTVTEEESDQQYRFVMPGPSISSEERTAVLDRLRGLNEPPEYIVASGSLPPDAPDDFYAELASVGEDLGARVIVDTSGAPLRKAVEHGLFLIKPNMRELNDLTDEEIADEDDVSRVASEFCARGMCRTMVVSLGSGGALIFSEDSNSHVRAPTVSIRSKVGAGDSMVAGMVLALSRGESMENAVRFGVAAGAAAVQTPGTELCRKEDAERLYEQMTSS